MQKVKEILKLAHIYQVTVEIKGYTFLRTAVCIFIYTEWLKIKTPKTKIS